MRFGAVALVLWLAGTASAQKPAAPADRAHIRFTMENPQLEPAAYSLEIFEDGTGSYTSSTPGESVSVSGGRVVRVRDPLLSRVFKTARGHHFFAITCESPQRNIALTGKKTLAYAGPDGEGSCTFNYSKDAAINQVAADLMDVAYTLSEGARLEMEHRHDRLALDGELEGLQDAAREHRALDLENIAPELQAIADDDAVMERARARARELLSEAASVR